MPDVLARESPQKITPFKILFLIVLADMVGFGIILPLMTIYARALGASNTTATLLLSAYSLCQFVASPILGAMSDRLGRRPILILSQAGSALASLTLAIATGMHFHNPSIGLVIIFGSRMVDGFSGGNLSTAQAYVSDVVEPQHRAKFMGLLGAAFGIGFALGPGLGSLVALLNPSLVPLVATGFSLTAAVLSYLYLPESLPPERRGAAKSRAGDLSQTLRLLKQPILFQINFVWALTMFSFVIVESVFSLFLTDRFGFGSSGIMVMFTMIGITIIAVQGGMIGPLTRRFGEWNLATWGPLAFALAMLLYTHISVHPAIWLLVVGAILNAIGRSLQTPSLSVIISRQAKGDQQGAVFGLFQSFGSLARVIGPAVAGRAYENGHLGRPFGIAGIVITIASVWMMVIRWQLRDVPDAPPAPMTAA